MSAATLRFRSDLVVSCQGPPEQTVFVIKDPVAERFFRFREIEHFIAQQLDGATSVETVRQRVEERFGAPLSQEALQQFIDRIHRLGLVTDGEAVSSLQSSRRRRIGGDVFYLRFKLFDPDRLFDWLLPKVRFLFTPYFVALSAALVVCAAGVSVANWTEIVHEFSGLFSFESIALAWFTILAVIGAHEFSHGLTCKYFGGRVREIGFMLIYFQPAFYCNVSDAWLFPEKSRRLWVTFAGAYFEIFLWGLATLVWRVTDPGSSINHFALVVTATSGFKMFLNLNPLIKLDGYYLLSDWLDVPNLRAKSVAYLRASVTSLFGHAPQWLKTTPSRERRIYLIYGLLAWSYSVWLFGLIASWVGGYLVEQYQAWGLTLFAVLLTGVFRPSIRHSIVRVRNQFTAPRGWIRALKRMGKFLAVLAVLTAALVYWKMELKVAGEFVVLPNHNADVRAKVEGIIQSIYHDEGDSVSKGELIARLADRDLRAELRKVTAEIDERRAKLKMLQAGPRPEEIELVRTAVAKAEERLKFARHQLERDKTLYDQLLLSRKDFELSQEQLSIRQKEWEEAKNQLDVWLAGTRPEEIEGLEAELRLRGSQQRYLEEQLALLAITSPASGIVTTRKLTEKVGQHVKKGDLIAEVHELKTITAETAIPEKEIGEVKPGQKVVLKARAHPEMTFQGIVTAIAPVATKGEDWRSERTVIVTTQLENTSLLLKPEMSGMAKIYCGERRSGELLLRRLMRYVRVEFWSWW